MADQRIESVGQALRGVYGDPAWLKRSVIGALVAMVPYLGMVWLMGYNLHYQRDVAAGGGERLPEWKLAESQLKTGLYASVAGIAYSLPVSLLLVGVFIVIIVITTIGASASEEAARVTVVLGAFLLVAATLLLSLVFGFVMWPVYTHVQRHDTFGSGFELRRIFSLMRQHSAAYWTAAWRTLALMAASVLVALVGTVIAMGGTFGIAVLTLPAEAAMIAWGLAATPVQLALSLLTGLITVPIGLATQRVWAGYARIAYELDAPSAGQPVILAE